MSLTAKYKMGSWRSFQDGTYRLAGIFPTKKEANEAVEWYKTYKFTPKLVKDYSGRYLVYTKLID